MSIFTRDKWPPRGMPGAHAAIEIDYVVPPVGQQICRHLSRASAHPAGHDNVTLRRNFDQPGRYVLHRNVLCVRGVTGCPLVVLTDIDKQRALGDFVDGHGRDVVRHHAANDAVQRADGPGPVFRGMALTDRR